MEPKKTVEDYTTDELIRFRESFWPEAEKFRKRQFIGQVIGACMGFIFLFLFLWPQYREVWFPAFVVWIATMLLFATGHKLKCPACKNDIECLPHIYCSKCGAPGLTKKWYSSAYCGICDSKLVWGKRRHFKLRFCTHCGVKLDDKGI